MSFAMIVGGEREYMQRQSLFSVLAIAAFFLARQPYIRKVFIRLVPYLYGITLVLLVALFYLPAIKGAHRWISFGFVSVQPSEFAKAATLALIARILLLEHVFAVSKYRIVYFLLLLAVITVPTILIFAQPDFGSAFLLCMTCLAFLMPKLTFTLKEKVAIVLIALLVCVSALFLLKDFQKKRIYSYVAGFTGGYETRSFNSLQATIAIGSGGLFGKGLGQGTQSSLSFLPEDHTDFAFASYAEQFGFAGIVILMMTLGTLLHVMIQKQKTAVAPAMRYFLQGVTMLFAVQSLVNMGMNLGLLPVVGVPLPLLSHGGSSLLLWSFMMGLF